ncbi:MAG: hypothetical protein JSR77_12370 [Planctomycetes bacterium]|nr:hypothetical protein [Planctomycetota bacterium]
MYHSFTPVGVDISGGSVNAVQLRRSGDRWAVHAAATFPRLSGDATSQQEAPRIARVLRRQCFRGDRVALCLPQELALAAVLDLPPASSGAPIDRIACAEMARMFKRDAATLETAWWELPASARQGAATQCMAVACPHDQSAPLLDAFEAAGLCVTALTPRGIATTRGCEQLLASSGPAVIADIGLLGSTLAAVHAGTIVYERSLEGCDVRKLSEDTGSALQLNPAIARMVLAGSLDSAQSPEAAAIAKSAIDRLVAQFARRIGEQLRVSIAYVGHRFPIPAPQTVLVTGEFASLPGLSAAIAGATQIACRPVLLGEATTVPPEFAHLAAQGGLIAALGLAKTASEAAC